MTQYDTSKWRATQRELAKKVIKRDFFRKPPRLVAGVDTAYSGEEAFSSVVVLEYKNLEVLETRTARCLVKTPYISSFLFFREGEPMIRAIARLTKAADIYLVNAHGVAHPERCGSASQLGVTLDIPTIGVAGRILVGEVSDSEDIGKKYLRDGEEVMGAALFSGSGRRPIYVSVGHKVSLESAIEIVRNTTKGSRMPEPLRLAHLASNEAKGQQHRESSEENRAH